MTPDSPATNEKPVPFPWLSVGIFVVILVAVIAVLLVFFQCANADPKRDFRFAQNDPKIDDKIWFVSNQMEPRAFISAIGQSRKTVVSPAFIEAGGANADMTSALVLAQTVLQRNAKTSGRDENTITLIRAYASDKTTLQYCRTNFGDIQQDANLTATECQAFLNQNDQFVVYIAFPNPKNPYPFVAFKDNTVTITTPDKSYISRTMFAFLKAVYPTATASVNAANTVIGKTTGGA